MAESLFAGPGEMRARCRGFDWTATPLGPVSGWAPSLRTAVDMCLGSAMASFVWWGPELIQFHNDAALHVAPGSHRALGLPARIAWGNDWKGVGHLIERVLVTGDGVCANDMPLLPQRSGPRETAWFTFSFEPIRDECATIRGVYCTAMETTDRVRAAAELQTRAGRDAYRVRLADALRTVADPIEAQEAASRALGEYLGVSRVAYGEVTADDVHIDFARNHVAPGVPLITGRFRMADYGESLLAALRAGQALIVPDVSTSSVLTPEERDAYGQLGIAALVGFPLIKGGRFVANLAVHHAKPRAWTVEEVALIEETAERTWSALERARAESALRESEARFRTMADLAPLILWETDPTGAGVSLNTRWLEYTGQTLDQTQNGGWLEAVHPDDRARVSRAYAFAMQIGEPLEVEHRVRRQDGVHRWFLVRQLPVRDERARITRWLGAATDIHAQRMALEEAERLAAERTAERDVLRRQLAEAEEAERRRLARDLHDHLGQQLTALRLGLDDAMHLAAQHMARDSPLGDRLALLSALASQMTAGARQIALELRPPELDDVGLESALETYVAEWSARFGIGADVAAMGLGERPVLPNVGSALYRIAQEALTNVAKHARAAHVSVIVEKTDGELRLVVEDDGEGFDPEVVAARASVERRLGLASMQERASLAGGSFTIESAPGSGTAIYARFPG